jgi:hypothetical protein
LKRKTNSPENPQYKNTILEVADGYDNLPALCLYEKFGFVIYPELYCNEYIKKTHENNIKMILDLDKITIDKLENIMQNKYDYTKSEYCQKEKEIDIKKLKTEYNNNVKRSINNKRKSPESKEISELKIVVKNCSNCKKIFASRTRDDKKYCCDCNTVYSIQCDGCDGWKEIDRKTFEELNINEKWNCDSCFDKLFNTFDLDSGKKNRKKSNKRIRKRSIKKSRKRKSKK